MENRTIEDVQKRLVLVTGIQLAQDVFHHVHLIEYIKNKYVKSKGYQDILNIFESKNNLKKLYKKIALFSIKNIAIEIKKYYDLRENQLSDIKQLFDEFELGYNTFSFLAETEFDALNFPKTQELFKKIINSINKLKINVPTKDLLNMMNNLQFFKFIDSNSEEKHISSAKLFEELISVVDSLNNSRKWYDFLINLYDTLSEYDVQKNINQYKNIADDLKKEINNKNKTFETSKIFISLKTLLDKIIVKASKLGYDNYKDIKLNNPKLTSLEKLLNSTLLYKPNVLCDPNSENRKVNVIGSYIKLSDITNKNYINFTDTTKRYCDFQPKHIEVFALNKIFINDDFNRTTDLEQLSIIAPTWEIVGSRKITLDGVPGKAYDPLKARNATGTGLPGDHGQPGYPGGSAGHFVGITETIINGSLLTISAVGGEGGPGQNGGNGATGKDGNDRARVAVDCYGYRYKCSHSPNCTIHDLGRKSDAAEFSGTLAQIGGKGGNGGRGGQGGNQGNITLNALHNYYRVSKYYSNGITGKNGTAGEGGPGGENGKSFVLTCTLTQRDGRYETYPFYDFWKKGQALKGDNGTDGANTENIKLPETVILQKRYITINKFKSYLRENLSNNIMENYLMNFINSVEFNKDIKTLYDMSGLIDDLVQLEDQFFALKDKISFLPFYKFLLDRINEYEIKTDQEKEVIQYLYAATWSKICSYNRNVAGLVVYGLAENGLVVDIQKYLNSVLKDIDSLKKSHYQLSITNYEIEYKNEIDKKINEANNFIDSSIKDAIDHIFDEINNQIGDILNKMIIKERMTIKEKENLEKQKFRLRDQLFITGFLGVIKIAGQLLSFTGPVGATVNSFISGGIDLAESQILNDGDINSLPGIVKDSMTKITEELTNKQTFYQKQLQDAEKELEKYLSKEAATEEGTTNDIKNIKTYIKNTRDKIEQKKNKGAEWDVQQVDELYELQKELGTHLEEQKTLLEKQNIIKNDAIDKKLKILNKIQNLISIPLMSVELYGKMKDQLDKIDQLDVAIQLKNDKINELVQHERNLYNILIPAFKNLKSEITIVKNGSGNKSHAALDISKWKIRSTIKDVKHLMQIMTQEFNGSLEQENLKYLIDKLDDSMSTMIDIFNRIEEYHSKAELAKYLKNIQSNKQLEIQNDELKKLDFIKRSNQILEKYEIAMSAFRQHIFPFANSYLKAYKLPAHLKSTNNDELTKEAVRIIESVKQMLEENDSKVRAEQNKVFSNITFKNTSQEISSVSSFYVWQHATNKGVISRFLEGQEIVLKADIRKGLPYDAIKFNEIGIRFKLKNEENQTELDKILDNYILSMTHLGNSYYRCGDKFYVMTSPEQELIFYLKKGTDGETSHRMSVYDTIRKHDPLLSPYTTWKLKLELPKKKVKDFIPLAKYKNQEIDLELEGGGQYVEGKDVCINMEEYYVVDDSISKINNDDLLQLDANSHRNNLYRSRRSVNKNDLVQNIEGNSFATSGSSRNVESSFINNIVNLISNSFSAFKSVISINQIGKRLATDKSNIHEGVSNKLDVNNIDFINLVNFQSPITELTIKSYESIDNKKYSSLNSNVNVSMLHNQSNLVLLDLLIRWKNGVKYRNERVLGDNCDLAYAQMLAYKQNVPANII